VKQSDVSPANSDRLSLAKGTTPPGVRTEREAADWVRNMFAGVAPRYDLLNHLLTFNIDRGWRKLLIQRVKPILERPQSRILDLCCGTGDVLLELQRATASQVLGGDFCHPMLIAARTKIASCGYSSALFEGDAMQMPFRDATLDLITIAFGFRNFVNYAAGLAELHRVLRPDGLLAILECSHPRGWLMKTAHGLYSRMLVPIIGGLVSGSPDAYQYLPDSVEKFPRAEELRGLMLQAGFRNVRFELLTSGVAAFHFGEK
jgi:demethylmenaquinone methyltransferase / 2-methoxy-6-polyprenyl-1,4-benzoquinol methylase